MYTANQEQCPVHGKAEDIVGAVEVEGLGGASGKRPVEGREGRRGVAERDRRVDALNEAGKDIVNYHGRIVGKNRLQSHVKSEAMARGREKDGCRVQRGLTSSIRHSYNALCILLRVTLGVVGSYDTKGRCFWKLMLVTSIPE